MNNQSIKYLSLLLLMIPALSGCVKWFDCERGAGPVTQRTYLDENYDELKIDIDADVILRQDTGYSLRIEAQENILEELDIYKSNDKLVIKKDECLGDHKRIKIYLTAPSITEINVSGDVYVISENTIATSELSLDISGSGEVLMDVDVDDLEVDYSGIGEVELSGKADRQSITISGKADFRNFDLQTNTTDIKISGDGDCEVSVADELDIKISGHGKVYYKGNPVVNQSITGIGEVSSVN